MKFCGRKYLRTEFLRFNLLKHRFPDADAFQYKKRVRKRSSNKNLIRARKKRSDELIFRRYLRSTNDGSNRALGIFNSALKKTHFAHKQEPRVCRKKFRNTRDRSMLAMGISEGIIHDNASKAGKFSRECKIISFLLFPEANVFHHGDLSGLKLLDSAYSRKIKGVFYKDNAVLGMKQFFETEENRTQA